MKDIDTNSRIYKIKRKRKLLSCSICPPHKGENSSRKAKYGAKKPKYKDKRILAKLKKLKKLVEANEGKLPNLPHKDALTKKVLKHFKDRRTE